MRVSPTRGHKTFSPRLSREPSFLPPQPQDRETPGPWGNSQSHRRVLGRAGEHPMCSNKDSQRTGGPGPSPTVSCNIRIYSFHFSLTGIRKMAFTQSVALITDNVLTLNTMLDSNRGFPTGRTLRARGAPRGRPHLTSSLSCLGAPEDPRRHRSKQQGSPF